MTLEYEINERDFLDFQLFTASKSDRISKKKRNGWIILTLGTIAASLYFYWDENIALSVYCVFVAITSGLFYPKYFNWRYKRHYKTYIQENYSKRFGQVEALEITNDRILSKDKTGEGKINLSEVERIDETKNHFFLKVSTGLSLVIPKKELETANKLRQKFKDIGLTVNDETNWTWK